MKRFVSFLSILLFCMSVMAHSQRPRVIVMTDGEVDDRCSMVRFLLYTNEMDVAAIIETNSCFQPKGWSRDNWLKKQIDAYEQVLPNLSVHASGYPSADYLRGICYVGDEEPSHIEVDKNASKRLPGQPSQIDPKIWNDTPGSNRIVEVLLEDDSRPVYIQAWGGGNTVAKAFQKLRDEYPDDYQRAISKAVVYNIWYQDGAGHYIEQEHPNVTMLLQHHFNGTWDYGTLIYTHDFVSRYLHNGQNPLGALYVQNMISEGDSPAFLYSLGNGLRSYEHPSYGGWGGRFYRLKGLRNVWRDTGSGDIRKWIEPAMHDFQARLDWCVTPEYEKANHHPVIAVSEGTDIIVHSGEKVTLKADITDSDSLNLDALWTQNATLYEQIGITRQKFNEVAHLIVGKYSGNWTQDVLAGTCREYVDLHQTSPGEVTFTAPDVKEDATIHIILEVTDTGFPSLTSYQRFIITIKA